MAGVRIVDHPTNKDLWLVQYATPIEGENVVVAEVEVTRSMDIASCIKEGQSLMGEWLLSSAPQPTLESWLTEIRKEIREWTDTQAKKKQEIAAAVEALKKETEGG